MHKHNSNIGVETAPSPHKKKSKGKIHETSFSNDVLHITPKHEQQK